MSGMPPPRSGPGEPPPGSGRPGQGAPPPRQGGPSGSGGPPPGQGGPPPGNRPPGGGGDLRLVQPQAENDKLVSALCYIFWFLVPIIILVTDMKNSRFSKVHAYQGLVFGGAGIAFYIVYGIFFSIMSAIFWVLGCILWVGFFLPIALGVYFAYLVFTKGAVELPILTDATKSVFKDL